MAPRGSRATRWPWSFRSSGAALLVAERGRGERQPGGAGRRAAADDRASSRATCSSSRSLTRRAAAIAELYRRRGFASATVKYAASKPIRAARTKGWSGRSSSSPKGRARVVGTVTFTGNTAISGSRAPRRCVKLAEGQPFYQPQVVADRDALIARVPEPRVRRGRRRRHARVLDGPHARRPRRSRSTRGRRRSSTTS